MVKDDFLYRKFDLTYYGVLYSCRDSSKRVSIVYATGSPLNTIQGFMHAGREGGHPPLNQHKKVVLKHKQQQAATVVAKGYAPVQKHLEFF